MFSTGGIPEIARQFGDVYYVKRLVGEPGDTLEVHARHSTEMARRSPAPRFLRPMRRGLANIQAMRRAGSLSRARRFMSNPGPSLPWATTHQNSFDGRAWGFVPAKEAVGTPCSSITRWPAGAPRTSRYLRRPRAHWRIGKRPATGTARGAIEIDRRFHVSTVSQLTDSCNRPLFQS